MENVSTQHQNWEIAIQTVLHRYHAQLELAARHNNSALIRIMAGEITRNALQLHSITEDTVKELEDTGE
ncbi:hypothetical protein FE784_38000 [Paenibacillus hemerocallicola]|jgi:hypothetical protein|uniref:Uncharacterized protein n=1 Tax=Paenibacillus hemerocallicola TaxID=1172614 RepID=A0A5C4SW76_9BACL|nr:hypothetical protein [Paenibacillus hemerocallicola]TNJ58679.1 hypothetical protein FE784_38000 [Paenibacillus hemerocallicola]